MRLLYDYSDMNSIPPLTPKDTVEIPKHILELRRLDPQIRSVMDPRLRPLHDMGASLKVLNIPLPSGIPDDRPLTIVAVFPSVHSALSALRASPASAYQLCQWSGRME